MFVNTETQQRATRADIKAHFPSVSLPQEITAEVLEGSPFAPLVETTRPDPENGGYIVEDGVELDGDVWRTKWREVTPEPLTGAAKTLHDIQTLELTITPRRLREAALGNAESIAFLQDIDDQISALRSQLDAA